MLAMSATGFSAMRISQGSRSRCGAARSRRPHIIGVSVSDTMAETTTAKVNVRANSRNMRPTMPLMNSSGMKTAISEAVSDTIVKPISRAPRRAASRGGSPSSMLRTTFSIITMASSITKPVPIVSAIRDRLSRLKPAAHITAKVATIDSGSATPAMIVARTVRRNSSTTRTTSAALSTSVNSTSAMEARIVSVESCTTCRDTPAASEPRRRGNCASTRSTVCTTLAPGWRCTSMMTAGVPLYQPPTREFSSPSTTSATSRSSTGALLR